MGKKIIGAQGKELDMGIYGQLSKEGLAALTKMLNDTMPPPKPKKKAVRKEKK